MNFLTQLNTLRVKIVHSLRRYFANPTMANVDGNLFILEGRYSLDRALLVQSKLEADLTLAIKVSKRLDAGGHFLDVGANVGHWTVPLAKIFAGVVAFEPEPDVRIRLERNVSVNGITNVEVSDKAISNKTGHAEFSVRSALDNSGSLNDGLGSLVKFDGLSRRTLMVQTQTLDSLSFGANSKISLVKIDVEGAEELVLQGAAQLIETFRPVFVTEILFSNTEDQHDTFSRRCSLFPIDYEHYLQINNYLVNSASLAPNELDDCNLFSIPKELLPKLRELLA